MNKPSNRHPVIMASFPRQLPCPEVASCGSIRPLSCTATDVLEPQGDPIYSAAVRGRIPGAEARLPPKLWQNLPEVLDGARAVGQLSCCANFEKCLSICLSVCLCVSACVCAIVCVFVPFKLLVFIFRSHGNVHRLVVRAGMPKLRENQLARYCFISAIIGSRHIWRRHCYLNP